MSEFSDAMATSWASAKQIFGDQVTIGDVVYDCIIHLFGVTDGVQSGRPGRSQNVQGTVVMTVADWSLAAGRKGTHVILGTDTYRVLNNPTPGYTSDTVTLEIGPLT